MPDLYDVLDEVVDTHKPSIAKLVEYCTKLLDGPMPDHAWDQLTAALNELEARGG